MTTSSVWLRITITALAVCLLCACSSITQKPIQKSSHITKLSTNTVPTYTIQITSNPSVTTSSLVTYTVVTVPPAYNIEEEHLFSVYSQVMANTTQTVSTIESNIKSMSDLLIALFGVVAAAGIVNTSVTGRGVSKIGTQIGEALKDLKDVSSSSAEASSLARDAVKESLRTLQGTQSAFTQASETMGQVVDTRMNVLEISRELKETDTESKKLKVQFGELASSLSSLNADFGTHECLMFLIELWDRIPLLYHEDPNDVQEGISGVTDLMGRAPTMVRHEAAHLLYQWCNAETTKTTDLLEFASDSVAKQLAKEKEPLVRVEEERVMSCITKFLTI